MKVQFLSIFLSNVLSSLVVVQGSETYSIHGSGTTNPSKCIWHIMAMFQEGSKVPTRLTYRAVGSSTGQAEFLGVNNTEPGALQESEFFAHIPHNDFGAGDIPISEDQYQALNDYTNGGQPNMVHLPFALSSVSFFHNIPGVSEGDDGIQLNACMLARIFDRKIIYWDDPEILLINPGLADKLPSSEYPIKVARRVHGSSSTSSITKYLHDVCPVEWPASKVGKELGAKGLDPWHVGTLACEGSAGVTRCIKGNEGSIGYLDSGHGWSENLPEVNVENKDKNFVTSAYARDNGGITAAAARATNIPTKADENWGDVHFINMSGEYTWPIVVMSYIYVRKDISKFITLPENRGLLKLFLESLYDEKYFGKCEVLGFSEVSFEVKQIVTEGINMIDWDFPLQSDGSFANMWSFEYADETRKLVGMDPFIISGKRKSLAGLSIEEIAGTEMDAEGAAKTLRDEERISSLEASYSEMLSTSDNTAEIQTALVLSAMSFTLWCCVIVGYTMNYFMYSKYTPMGRGSGSS